MEETGFDLERLMRYFKEEYSDRDRTYVEGVFCDDSKEKKLEHFLSRQFYGLLPEEEVNKKDLDYILYKLHYDINTKTAKRKERRLVNLVKWSIRIAGIILLPLVIFMGVKGYLNSSTRELAWVEIKAPAWAHVQFSLPDGTTGYLNSNSSIKYNGNFSTDRQVSLIGEAFFDVVKDDKRPFIVNTKEVNVKVLGTRFNIASYENEDNVEVVLEEGKLIFSENGTTKSCFMNPNDLVSYDKTQKILTTEKVEPQKYSSWTECKLVFRNDPLDIIARRLGRWYNIDIEIKGNMDRDPRLRATFINESLEEVLGLLKRSLRIDYIIENGDLQPDEIYAKKKVILTVKP